MEQLLLILGLVTLLADFVELWDPDVTFSRSQGTNKCYQGFGCQQLGSEVRGLWRCSIGLLACAGNVG